MGGFYREREMDSLSPEERSIRMSLVRSKDTQPELFVRKLVHRMGFRYRSHRRDLPGHPDMVFASRGKIIFVHGCFWHRHGKCEYTRWPKSRLSFWKPKLEQNHARDKRNRRALAKLGWRVLVVWECQLKFPDKVAEKIYRFVPNE